MNKKVRIKYWHPLKENVELEVVGRIQETTEDKMFITRIDGYTIDIDLKNIISQEDLIKQ